MFISRMRLNAVFIYPSTNQQPGQLYCITVTHAKHPISPRTHLGKPVLGSVLVVRCLADILPAVIGQQGITDTRMVKRSSLIWPSKRLSHPSSLSPRLPPSSTTHTFSRTDPLSLSLSIVHPLTKTNRFSLSLSLSIGPCPVRRPTPVASLPTPASPAALVLHHPPYRVSPTALHMHRKH